MLTTLAPVTPATLARPAYLTPVAEPGFGTTLRRITGDTGGSMPGGCAGGTWWTDSRHGYSRRQPWNSDGTLAMIEQRGGTPSKWIVDAKTWLPVLGNRGTIRVSKLLDQCTEVRWMTGTRMCGLITGTQELVVFDVLTDQVFRRIPLNAAVGFMGEANLSLDGSVVALGNTSDDCVVVDIAGGRVSPVQKVGFIRESHALGNLSVSPLATGTGGKVVVKASGTPETVRVYKFGTDLLLAHHFESSLCLSHADVGVTPAGREAFVGGSRDYFGTPGSFSKDYGRVAAIDLESGLITNISAGKTWYAGTIEAADQHCSCRGPRGWVLTTYAGPHETIGRFCMELVLWKLDGSRDCVRFGVTRTNETGIYRAEAHGVCRPDGKAVMFASNWQHATSAAGATSDIKSFVYALDDDMTPIDPPPPVLERFYIKQGRRCYPNECLWDRETDSPVMLEAAVRIMNGGAP